MIEQLDIAEMAIELLRKERDDLKSQLTALQKPLAEWLDAQILEDEGAYIYARDAGEWERCNFLDGHKEAMVMVKQRIGKEP